ADERMPDCARGLVEVWHARAIRMHGYGGRNRPRRDRRGRDLVARHLRDAAARRLVVAERRRRGRRGALVTQGVLLVEETQDGRTRRALERGTEVPWKSRLDEELRAGAGVRDLDANEVQEGAVEPVLLFEVAVRRHVAIAFVAEDRMADGCEVPPRLM